LLPCRFPATPLPGDGSAATSGLYESGSPQSNGRVCGSSHAAEGAPDTTRAPGEEVPFDDGAALELVPQGFQSSLLERLVWWSILTPSIRLLRPNDVLPNIGIASFLYHQASARESSSGETGPPLRPLEYLHGPTKLYQSRYFPSVTSYRTFPCEGSSEDVPRHLPNN
jgi:hypothetical protein